MATPRGITQPHTSFIGSACQGIHHTPVTKHTDTQTIKVNNTKTQKRKLLASTIQFSHNTTPTRDQATITAAGSRQGAQQGHTNLCCPRHPTVHQCFQTFCHETGCASPTHSTTQQTTHQQAVRHLTIQIKQPTTTQVCVHPAQHISWQSHTRRHQPHKNRPTTVS